MYNKAIGIICMLALAACKGGDSGEKQKEATVPPRGGTIVAHSSVPVEGDSLNHFTFETTVVAEAADKGIYTVKASYGPNYAEGSMTMPESRADLVPIIKRNSPQGTCIIGFKVPGDTTFYDYFEVSSTNNQTKMRYLKSFTF